MKMHAYCLQLAAGFTLCVCAHQSAAQLLHPISALPPVQAQSFDQFGADIAIHDGRMLTTASAMYTASEPRAYLFDLDSDQLIHTFELERTGFGVNALAVEMTDDYIVIGWPTFDESKIFIYNPTTYELIRTITLSDQNVLSRDLATAIDGRHLAVGNRWSDQQAFGTGIVQVFDLETGELEYEIHPEPALEQPSFGAQVAMDEDWLVVLAGGSTSRDRIGSGIYVYDARTGAPLAQYNPTLGDGQESVMIAGIAMHDDQIVFSQCNSAGFCGLVGFSNTTDLRLAQLPDISAPQTLLSDPQRSYDNFGFGTQLLLNEDFIVARSIAWFGQFDSTGRVFVFDRADNSLVASLAGEPQAPSQGFFLPNLITPELVRWRTASRALSATARSTPSP